MITIWCCAWLWRTLTFHCFVSLNYSVIVLNSVYSVCLCVYVSTLNLQLLFSTPHFSSSAPDLSLPACIFKQSSPFGADNLSSPRPVRDTFVFLLQRSPSRRGACLDCGTEGWASGTEQLELTRAQLLRCLQCLCWSIWQLRGDNLDSRKERSRSASEHSEINLERIHD